MDRVSLRRLPLRIAVSLVVAWVLYTAWMSVFIPSVRSAGAVVRALLWVAAPPLTAAGFALGLTLFRWEWGSRGEEFLRNYTWPLVGCTVGAVAVFPFGPMLIAFGMLPVGTFAVTIREAWLILRGRSHERIP